MKRPLIPFSKKVWKEYKGSEGCIPINTQQTISFERLAPGDPAPPPKPTPPKPTREQIKAPQVEQARQKALAEQAKKQEQNKPKAPAQGQPKIAEAEDHDKLPAFDLQDIPGAMGKIGWPVSAKLARKWFASPKHTYHNDYNSVQPIDDTTVTLNWALKYGSVRDKFDALTQESIYSKNAIEKAKNAIIKKISDTFINKKSTDLSFDTAPYTNDLRQFHIDWQFQLMPISFINTTDGLYLLTDLTAALGNFSIYAAIGNAKITKEQFFKYDNEKKTKTYCIDAVAEITHIYVYIKDSYSFNDDPDSSQYLGHWNKIDMITAYRAGISSRLGNQPITETKTKWEYLPSDPIDKPVDKRRGLVRKLIEEDVYYPVYNKAYRDWREQHNRGGDFMIYSKPQYFKLNKTIKIKLETICRQPEPM